MILKNPVMIVTLEKIISEDRDIKIDIIGSEKNNVDSIVLEDNIEKVSISGPRSLVNQVKRIVGTIKVDKNSKDSLQNIKLNPVDSNGKVVEGITLEKNSVNADIKLINRENCSNKIKYI